MAPIWLFHRLRLLCSRALLARLPHVAGRIAITATPALSLSVAHFKRTSNLQYHAAGPVPHRASNGGLTVVLPPVSGSTLR